MNSTIKVVLIWVLILVAAVGLYNFVEKPNRSQIPLVDLTDFLTSVQMGRVSEVTIRGQKVVGKLREGNQQFRASIPADYPTIYDTLTTSKVKVMVIPGEDRSLPSQLSWLAWGLALLVAFAFGWLCSSWRTRGFSNA